MKSKIIYEKKYQHRYQEIENEAMKNVSEEQIPNLSINSDGFIHKFIREYGICFASGAGGKDS